MFAPRDVTTWEVDRAEPLGRMEKTWLLDTERTRWLYKPTRYNRTKDGSKYLRGEHWAEKAVAQVAHAVELPAVHIELAYREQNATTEIGCLSKSMLEQDQSLVHGDELLADIGVRVHERSGQPTKKDAGHTFENIKRALEPIDPPPSAAEGFDAWTVFVAYVVMDAVVGNTDRHSQNWGVIQSNSARWLAPSFDHAASLGYELSDSERVKRLESRDLQYQVAGFGKRGKSKFAGHPQLHEAAVEALGMIDQSHTYAILERFAAIDLHDEVLEKVPSDFMSNEARQFACALFESNLKRLLSLCNANL